MPSLWTYRRARIDPLCIGDYCQFVTATQIIEAMRALPPAELAAVVRHAKSLEIARQLSPDELRPLLDRFVEATDPAEVERLNEQITKGFYGRP